MSKDENKPLIMLAAGGTGGHIFPAEALAEALLQSGYRVVLVTDTRFADYNRGSGEGIFGQIPLYYIQAGTLGGGLMKKIKNSFAILRGIFQARRLMKELKPAAVVGFGGYPSFPTMIAATQKKLPTIIHEQNSVLGKANRVLGAKVHRIATAYPEVRGLPQGAEKKIVLTGNPVRAAIRALAYVPYPELKTDGQMRILVLGGSQGASVFSEVIPAALKELPEAQRARIRIDQQCRPEQLDSTREAYKKLQMQVDLASFFNDVPARLAAAHVVISRAGASTVAELMASARPSILVPLPTAADNHQMHNAQALEALGGCWVMPQDGFTPTALASRLEAFLNLPASLAKASRQLRKESERPAAEELARLVGEVIAEQANGKKPAEAEILPPDSKSSKGRKAA